MSTLVPSRLLAAVATFACTTLVAAQAEDIVVLRDGIAVLKLSSPAPSDLSSGAALNLNLPSATMNAQATASVGGDQANGGFWHKDEAQVDAQVKGPLGSSFSATGGHELSFDYKAPDGTSRDAAGDHLVRSENQTGNVSLTVPVEGAELVVGAEHSSTLSQDISDTRKVSPVVGTQDHALSARLQWQVLPQIEVEGGAAARTSDVSWRDGQSRSSSYRSVDPNVSVGLTPWKNASLTTKFEHTISPYDTAAFASYSTGQPSNAPALQPDHAWQLETRFEQGYGAAKLSASYTVSRSGTATELAESQTGVQTPASTPLLHRDDVSVALAVPLDGIGLAHTDLTSNAQWQDSRVVDPVTGTQRAASGEVPRKYALRLAHALVDKRLRLGLTGDFTGTRTAYQARQISTTGAGASLGAFLSFTPGPYQLDLNVNGLYGSSTTDYVFRGTRPDSQLDHVASQPGSGPMLNISLHKPL